MAKKTVSDIQERAETLKQLWKGRNDAIAHYNDLFFLKHYSGTTSTNAPNEGGVNAWRTPGRSSAANLDSNGAYRVTATDYTDFTVSLRSMVMAQQPVIRCYSDKENRIGDERAQLAEKVLMAIRYVNRMRAERDFIDDAVHEQFSTGWSVIYAYFDEELAKSYEKDGEWRDFPIIIKSMPAQHCYPKPGGKRGRWREVVYSWEREVADVEDEFDVKLTKTRNKFRSGEKANVDAGDEPVDFYDYWWWEDGDVWHAIVAGEDWVKKPANMSKWYKGFPYTVCAAINVPSATPDEMGVSPYMSMEPNVELQEDLTSRIMTGITYHADPTLVAQDGDGAPIDVDKQAGGIIHLRTGQDLKAMTGPTVSQDVYQMLNYVSSAVQRSGLPSISYGLGLSGLSGYAISLMGQGGQMKMTLPVANLEVALSIVMDKTLDLLRNFYGNKDIFAYGQDRFGKMFSVKMKGDDLKGLRVDVKLKPRIPQDEVARANRARLLDGIVSRMYIKDSVLELQDPVADNNRQQVEQFMQHPLIQSAEMARAAQRWGIPAGDIQAFMSTMQQQQGGAPQGPSRPGNAGQPPPPPGAGAAPQTPDDMAMQQMLAAQRGDVPRPDSAGMSMGGMSGGGF